MESNFVFKLSPKAIQFEKNVLKTKPKGSKFERTRFKPSFGEPPHEFYNVKTWTRGFLERKNHAKLVNIIGFELS